ncbi:MAG: Tn3 family transposase [Geminicoccaceae bacterium]
MPRRTILSHAERQSYETPPAFKAAERSQDFDLPTELLETAKTFRRTAHQIGFLVSCAYFSAAKRFFTPLSYHAQDIRRAAQLLDIPTVFDARAYSNRTRQRHERIILRFYGYRRLDARAAMVLTQEIAGMAAAHLKPRLIFWRCLDLMVRERVELPGEHRLTALISKALQERRQWLTERIEQRMTSALRDRLDDLFVQEPADGTSDPGRTSHYRLTLLKRLSQSTAVMEIRQRTADLNKLRGMHDELAEILGALDLGREGVRYYAGNVLRSEIFQLARRADPDRHLHLIAFIAHQVHRLQDNLVDTLLTVLQSHQNTCLREHKESCYARRHERDARLGELLEEIDTSVVSVLQQVRQIVHDLALSDAEKVHQACRMLPENGVAAPDAMTALRNRLETDRDNDGFNDILESNSLKLQNRISPILKVLTFQSEPSAAALFEAIEHFKAKEGAISRSTPHAFLEPDERAAVICDGRIARISLYKAFLFAHTARALKAGTLNLEHSYKYRPLDDYLIDKGRWQREKDVLLEHAGLLDFADPCRVLDELDEALHAQYLVTNRRIAADANPHFRISAKGRFRTATPKQEEKPGEPLQLYLPQRHYVPLPQILATVNRHAGFVQEFEHWSPAGRNQVRDKALFAAIMGLGCGIGTRKMARIAQGVGEAEIEHAVNWRFSLDNIQAANDRTLRLANRLELPDVYRGFETGAHTASDGQKFEVRKESLNANYSFKYFGKGQGVSAYSFIDDRQLLWHSLVFSAAERESAYVIDGLMRNDVVQSAIHSTDSHGYAEAIFAAAHLIGVSYAPRLKNIAKQTLYIFASRRGSESTGWAVTPDKYVNDELIRANWDDILRLIATIKLKETTASDIFRRLNSYAKQHTLYRALKAFGQIIKSLLILRYINDLDLRQAIEQQLSRIELANRFTRDVAIGAPREFIQADKEDQEVAEACNRLIKNSIVCWNYLYLEHRLATMSDPGQRQAMIDSVTSHSIASWRHVNMLGEYDFSDEKLKDAFGLRLKLPTPENLKT